MSKAAYAALFLGSVVFNAALLNHMGKLSGFWAGLIPLAVFAAIVFEEIRFPKDSGGPPISN